MPHRDDFMSRQSGRQDPWLGIAVQLRQAVASWRPTHVVCVGSIRATLGALLADSLEGVVLIPSIPQLDQLGPSLAGLVASHAQLRILLLSSPGQGEWALQQVRALLTSSHQEVRCVMVESPPPPVSSISPL